MSMIHFLEELPRTRIFLRKQTIGSAIFILLFSLHPFSLAFAHSVSSDKTMSIELHVDPDDNPLPGQQAQLYFHISDSSKRFHMSSCTCMVQIQEQGKQLQERTLTKRNSPVQSVWSARVPVIFPTRAVYKIIFIGKPIVGNLFPPFTVSWLFRVDPSESRLVETPKSEIVLLAIGASCVLIVLMFLGIFIKREILDPDSQVKKQ